MRIIKKSILGLVATCFLIPTVYAQDASSAMVVLLAQIKQNTDRVLASIDNYPAYLGSYFGALTRMAMSWLDTEDSGTISNNQYSFAQLTAAYRSNESAQASLSQAMTRDYLAASKSAANLKKSPYNENDLSYMSVLGQLAKQPSNPYDTKNAAETSARNFISNASGTGFVFPQADSRWPDSIAKQRYQNFFYTLAAIQSYDSYIISSLYNPTEKDKLASDLVDRASSSDWFEQVKNESLGAVLRHILMYDSQIYVQLNRLVKLQQQQMATIGMTNTLLIMMGGSMSGPQLYQKASSTQ